MSEDDGFSRRPWSTNAAWVWDTRRNRRLLRTATLRVALRSSSTDLAASVNTWLNSLTTEEDGLWYWGGFTCALTHLDTHDATLELSSSGEDTLESLEHASQWLHRELVDADSDIRVRWDELPLK